MTKRRVIIVGGGISGLATAWQIHHNLHDEQLELVVLEAARRAGGTAWTERRDGYLLETGPNGFLDNKPHTLALCRSVGLADQLVRADEAAKRRYIFLGDRLRQMPSSPFEFIRTDLLTWRGKLRCMFERLVPSRRDDADESIHAFGCRRIGKEATEVFLDAYVTGILAGDPALLSLRACFPRIAELERQFGSLLRAQRQLARLRRAKLSDTTGRSSSTPFRAGGLGGTLTVTRGGMSTLIERLVQRLGSSLRYENAALDLERVNDSIWSVRCAGSPPLTADAVVLACPAYVQSELLRRVDARLADEIAGILYCGVVVAAVGFRQADVSREAVGFGYLTPQRLGRPVLGVVWSSSIFPDQAPAGCVQFRAILGGWTRSDVLAWSDDQIVQAVCQDLQVVLGIAAAPVFSWICRWNRGIPQYQLGHLDRLQRIESLRVRHSGLFLSGNCYRGISLNDCTREAESTARLVGEYFGIK